MPLTPPAVARTRARAAVHTLAIAAAALTGCSGGAPDAREGVALGDVSVRIASVHHRRACLSEDGRTMMDARPAYLVELHLRNGGAETLRYDPRHGRHRAGDPDDLRLAGGGAAVAGIIYDPGVLVDGQVGEVVSLKPGDEVRDVFVFEPPPSAVHELIFTVPAALWGKAGAAELRVAHDAGAPEKVVEHPPGEAAALGAARVTMVGADVVLPVFRAADGRWDADTTPAVALRYRVAAAGAAVTYDAEHGGTVAWGPVVRTGAGAVVPAVHYDGAPELRAQLRGKVAIAAGDAREDYALYSLPPPGTDALSVELPGSLVGAPCAALFRVPYLPKPAPTRDEALKEAAKTSPAP
ncbi:MAG TPA: hypothetical protein VG389_27290 [Myxococcota bacterium]|jgi:hypothetical protein|nr:hypothetical protein [Myxococcota bacterium]